MGDRRVKSVNLTQICLDIMTKGWTYSVLRDELYLQLIKQTNYNQQKQSLKLGWELMAICLTFFPPSHKLYPILYEYIKSNIIDDIDCLDSGSPVSLGMNTTPNGITTTNTTNSNSEIDNNLLNKYATTCLKRLERIHTTGAKKGLKKPSLDEIDLSKVNYYALTIPT